jgi:hypothetical protein
VGQPGACIGRYTPPSVALPALVAAGARCGLTPAHNTHVLLCWARTPHDACVRCCISCRGVRLRCHVRAGRAGVWMRWWPQQLHGRLLSCMQRGRCQRSRPPRQLSCASCALGSSWTTPRRSEVGAALGQAPIACHACIAGACNACQGRHMACVCLCVRALLVVAGACMRCQDHVTVLVVCHRRCVCCGVRRLPQTHGQPRRAVGGHDARAGAAAASSRCGVSNMPVQAAQQSCFLV